MYKKGDHQKNSKSNCKFEPPMKGHQNAGGCKKGNQFGTGIKGGPDQSLPPLMSLSEPV
jgi:hypothetical protein